MLWPMIFFGAAINRLEKKVTHLDSRVIFPGNASLALGTPGLVFFWQLARDDGAAPTPTPRSGAGYRSGSDPRVSLKGHARGLVEWRAGPPPAARLQPPLEESEVSRLKWSQPGLPQKRPWASAGFRAGPVRHGKFSGHHSEGSCSGVYRTFFVGAHPWKVSGRRGGGP